MTPGLPYTSGTVDVYGASSEVENEPNLACHAHVRQVWPEKIKVWPIATSVSHHQSLLHTSNSSKEIESWLTQGGHLSDQSKARVLIAGLRFVSYLRSTDTSKRILLPRCIERIAQERACNSDATKAHQNLVPKFCLDNLEHIRSIEAYHRWRTCKTRLGSRCRLPFTPRAWR